MNDEKNTLKGLITIPFGSVCIPISTYAELVKAEEQVNSVRAYAKSEPYLRNDTILKMLGGDESAE